MILSGDVQGTSPLLMGGNKLKRYLYTFLIAGCMGLLAQCLAGAYSALGLTMPLLTPAVMLSLGAAGIFLWVSGLFDKLSSLSFAAMLFPFAGLSATVAGGAASRAGAGAKAGKAVLGAFGEILGVIAPGFAVGALLALLRAFVL